MRPITMALLMGIVAWVAALLTLPLSSSVVISIQHAVFAWALAIGAPIATYVYARLRVASGRYDLTIDPMRRTVTLPMTFGRKMPIELRFADVQAVEIEDKVSTDSDGDTTHAYFPTLVYRDAQGTSQRAKLTKWSPKADADSLAEWVRGKLGLKTASSLRSNNQAA
jgi:hypothetical protein